VAAAAPVRLSAAPKPLATDAVVVTGGRRRQELSRTPIPVQVIGRRVLEAAQSLSLADGLSYQPGLRLETNCQNCGFTQLRLNGLGGAYTQFLIDGRPVFSGLAGVYGLEILPPEMIERVEVVRGGGSALYGTNAIAGTVNLITRDPKQNGFGASLQHTQYPDGATGQTARAHATAVNDSLTAGATVFAFHRERDAWDANGDAMTEMVRLRNTSLGFSGYVRPDEHSRLQLKGHALTEDRRGGTALEVAPHLSPVAEALEHRIAGGELSYERYSMDRRHHTSMYIAGQTVGRESYYGTDFDPNAYGTTQDATLVGGIQHALETAPSGAGTLSAVGGAEAKLNWLDDQQPGYGRQLRQRTQDLAGFAQVTWRPTQRLALGGGGRLDHYSVIQRDTLSFRRWIASPRVNVLYRPTAKLRLRAGYARAFRAPQAFDEDLHLELVAGGAIVTRQARDLRAERSDAVTASATWEHRFGTWRLRLRTGGFWTVLQDNFIDESRGIDTAGNRIFVKTNGAGRRVMGANGEVELVRPGSLWFSAGWTAQRNRLNAPLAWSETAPPVTEQLRTPNQYGFLAGSWQPASRWTLSLSGTLTGPMTLGHFAGAIPADRLETSPWMGELNAKVSREFRIGGGLALSATLGLYNLTNTFQRDLDRGLARDPNFIYGPNRPRAAFVEIRLHK
jgi:outer membrane receptor for ferrienterochelin and colicins